MDQTLQDHSRENLLNQFPGTLKAAELDSCSILVKETQIPWLIFIPKAPLTELDFTAKLYQEIHALAFALQETQELGHFNLAKIGNKNPWLHIHLVFREESDEAWPDPVWCHEPLQESHKTAQALCGAVQSYYKVINKI